MLRNIVVCVLLGVTCVALVACGTFEVGRQTEAGVGQAEAAENTAPITKETDMPPTATAETVLAGSEVVSPTITPEMASGGATGVEAEIIPDEGAFAQKVSETVALPACYDFDGGASVVPPDTACDFSMLPGPDNGTIEIYPQAGAQLAYGGVFPEAPTLAQCVGSYAFSGERETVAPLAAMYVCYRTGEGRTGYLHFTAADLEQAGTLTFDWVTFAAESGDGTDVEGEALNYYNDSFGFRLALPPTWNGFQTTEHTNADNESPDVGSVCFAFAGHTPICVLKIDVWTKMEWRVQEWVPDGYYLGENEAFVFAAGPHREECVQLDDFQCARHQEIPSILATFRFDAE